MSELIDNIIIRLQTYFDPEVLGAALVDTLADVIVALLTFTLFYLIWRVLKIGLQFVLTRTLADETTASFAQTALKYTILVLGAIQALTTAGIDTAALLGSLGIAGLTIGFAARDALSNLISGLLIFWDRPFVIGDLVEVGSNYGQVDTITLRSTRVVTSDGRMLAVPNAEIINSTVASYTNFPHLRLDIDVTIGVNESIDRTRQLLLSVIEGDLAFLKQPAPRVVVAALNDYNVALQLQVWLENEREHVEERSDLREKVFTTLTEAGIDMPYETLRLTPLEVKQIAA